MNDIEINKAQLVPVRLGPTVMAKMDAISESAENVDKALEAAKKAKESADAASKKNAGWSITGRDKKEAIEALQQSGLELAIGIQNIADAQKVMFDNLLNISEATKYLFGIGIANIATTRVVIDTITSGLQDASKRRINQRAKESLMGVVQQLKAQEDLFNKVDKLTNRTKFLEKELSAIKGSEDSLSYESSLCGLSTRMTEVHAALQKEIILKSEAARTEAVGRAKSYFDTRIKEEVSRANNAYDSKGTALQVESRVDENIAKAKNELSELLSDEKSILIKKISILKLCLWILGLVSIVNLVITMFIVLR